MHFVGCSDHAVNGLKDIDGWTPTKDADELIDRLSLMEEPPDNVELVPGIGRTVKDDDEVAPIGTLKPESL